MSLEISSNILIRAYEPRDKDDLDALYALPEIYGNTLQLPFGKYPDTVIPDDKGMRIVAEVDGKAIGSGMLIRSPRVATNHVFGLAMVVHPSFHRHGIGTSILESLISVAFQWYNAHRLELEVFTHNQAAIGLYEKHGFVAEGVKHDAVYRNGRYVDLQIMALIAEDR